ncbi:beta-ketoacyl-ACP synthase II [Clostridium saccharoperbutylacetonicum]|jgi:3-oxoacyl-[acyl-carrier-protein] synthase II|uniref:3-oxoacyl-[acyl-carrier-protein] synthase 2 n=1 Tax=Clostridium saccharoperbutylacetonicum N1-4(HMT) TaxID=931276 RepID=M1MTR3_9CLOT|nr:beta-ketoacyl-ACP synthase II [Clostridium saccharoperbutylacetonicum]AGF54942.1 3-oxoacyl-[acyl-carrier-protein] synthase 2 [Clostridium saccharoperbutylacetonicum N1-4(HMT)]AQR93864.1 3-oxoacyl-[acyl-carrier-protein] synthase 2 [Clostridium saccharoperbutylacetonicum]NRT64353.1 3-oxoacyl-[acyl-carrier-protein] synthase II [Clostridium saccharoperbutylacetonicum]NSB27722.1 3-oxoacyl-[acyl-carrier-protein] synthase II [Clostridium saccharoperbutylacetonicum]NSB29564.1 3-oxoacyl-[acyl-carrie
MEKRVVITGMGALTPIGNDVNSFWDNAKSGKLGIDYITLIDTELVDVKIAAEVKDFDADTLVGKKEAKRLDRFAQFALVASDEAIKDSGIDLEKEDLERFGVMLGSGIGGFQTIEDECSKLATGKSKRVSPFFVPMAIINLGAGNVAIKYGLKGPCTSAVTACATGTNNIGDAFRAIKHGYADVMLAGGAEAPITRLGVTGFNSMKALNTDNNPTKASIPFDKDRSGFVMGEGAGVVILESLEHAQARGANILGEIVGYGSTCDAYHITSPDPEGTGAARAMKEAIQEAGITPGEVSYINAHGTSTPLNDKFETLAIKKAFGEDAYKVPISSTKSMTGHLLGAAGAIEAIICAKALQEGFIPPTIGYETKDEELDLDYVPNEGRKKELEYALTNSLGFGGHNATLLLKKWK